MERGAYQSLVFTNAAMQSGTRIVSKSSCQIVNVPTEDCKQTGSAFAKRGFTRRVRTLRRIFRSGRGFASSSPLHWWISSCCSCHGLATFTHDTENKRRRKSVRRRSLTLPLSAAALPSRLDNCFLNVQGRSTISGLHVPYTIIICRKYGRSKTHYLDLGWGRAINLGYGWGAHYYAV